MDRSIRRKVRKIKTKLANYRPNRPVSWRFRQRWGSVCTIYALMDPISGRIHYVGRSVKPKERYQKHLRQGRGLIKYLKQTRNPVPQTKDEWIGHLLLKKRSPVLIELEKVPYPAGQQAESYWYDVCIELEQPLMNKIRAMKVKRGA